MTDKLYSTAEKRNAPRYRVLKRAKIVFNNANSTISCLVRDQSELGAKLKVDSILGIPDSFMLQIMEGNPRACKVVWRTNRELGVTFQ